MRNRISQRPYINNGRECVLVERMKQGDCTYCPANHGENTRGSKSKWGRKVAAKRQYSTGKGRKEINWYKYGPRDLMDEHYNPEHHIYHKRRLYKRMNKGQLQQSIKDLGRMLHNDSHWANKLWQNLSQEDMTVTDLNWSDSCFDYQLIVRRQCTRRYE